MVRAVGVVCQISLPAKHQFELRIDPGQAVLRGHVIALVLLVDLKRQTIGRLGPLRAPGRRVNSRQVALGFQAADQLRQHGLVVFRQGAGQKLTSDRIDHDTALARSTWPTRAPASSRSSFLLGGNELGQQRNHRLALFEGFRRLARFDRGPGRCQIGLDPSLELLLESFAGRLAQRRQIGIGRKPCLKIEPVAQRERLSVALAESVEGMLRLLPRQCLPLRLQGRKVLAEIPKTERGS